jgi:hypothetical protein
MWAEYPYDRETIRRRKSEHQRRHDVPHLGGPAETQARAARWRKTSSKQRHDVRQVPGRAETCAGVAKRSKTNCNQRHDVTWAATLCKAKSERCRNTDDHANCRRYFCHLTAYLLRKKSDRLMHGKWGS